MKQQLIQYFEKFTPLTDKEKTALIESMILKTYPKGSFLIEEGKVCTDCFFVLKGCVRQFSHLKTTERTLNFFTEHSIVISMESFSQKIPATHSYVCLEETTVVVGDASMEKEMYENFPVFETISRQILEKEFNQNQLLLSSLLSAGPEERYLILSKERPELMQRVPQYYLASFLGMKPESLSRIRKRLSHKS